MTLSNMRGLHDPVRSEREAVLEADNKVLREALASLLAAAADFHEAAMENLSDSAFDRDGILAEREAKLSVVALPDARRTLATLSTTSKGGDHG